MLPIKTQKGENIMLANTSLKTVAIQADTDFDLTSPIFRLQGFNYTKDSNGAVRGTQPSKIVFTISMVLETQEEDTYYLYQQFETIGELKNYLRVQLILIYNVAGVDYVEDELENILSFAFYPGGVKFDLTSDAYYFPGRIR